MMDAINTGSSTERDEQLLAAARRLAPFLRAQASEARELRRLPTLTVDELDKAGLFKLSVPQMFGGDEVSLSTLLDLTLELGAADGSVAWTHGILSGGIWMAAALYSREVGEEVFADGGNFRTASVMSPSQARTRRVAEGLVIEEARWAFNSGIHHAGWDVLCVPVMDDQGNVTDIAAALVPARELTLLDDWDTIGLRGTGSVSVAARDLFVPERRLAMFSKVLADDYASSHLSDRTHYNLPILPMLAVKLAFPCLAIAREALRLFLARAVGRPMALTFHTDRSKQAVTHLQAAEASVKIDAAETIIRRSIDEIETAAACGYHLTREQRGRIWRDASFCAQLTWQAASLLADASGGGFARVADPMNRCWHDLRVATLHAGLSATTTLEATGRLMFGLPSNTPFL